MRDVAVTAGTLAADLDRVYRGAVSSPQPLDVVIVDRGLPDRDGIDVVMELRTQLPTLPVIVASGYGDLPESTPLRDDPHVRFMSKLYDMSALISSLRALHVRTKEMG